MLTSASEKSSGAKSTSTPSTPIDNRILPTESRHSHSSPSESTSVGFLSEARQDREINKDVFLQQEAIPVCSSLQCVTVSVYLYGWITSIYRDIFSNC